MKMHVENYQKTIKREDTASQRRKETVMKSSLVALERWNWSVLYVQSAPQKLRDLST